MKSILVVPDTNIFLHCKALNELPWSVLGADEITIVLVDPVISELDGWKDRGEDRRAKRVRALLPQIRELLVHYKEGLAIAQGPPVVRLILSVAPGVGPSSADPDARILEAALDLQRSSGQSVLVLTRDVIMALRARRQSLEVRLISPEDTEWNARPERPDPQMKELQQQLMELKRMVPQVEATLTSASGVIEKGQFVVFQPKLTEFDRIKPISDWAERFFEEHPPHRVGKQWDLDDSYWRSRLFKLDHEATLELARRTSGGIGVLHLRNVGAVNAEDVRVELIADGAWRLTSRIPRLHFDVPSPPIGQKVDPLDVRIQQIPTFDFAPRSTDPSEPVWEVVENGTSGVSRLVARIPLVRHRDEVPVEFSVGHTDGDSAGKLIVRITVARNPKPMVVVYRLEHESRDTKLSELCTVLGERGELKMRQRNHSEK